jgi:hypothetical protein
MAAIVQGLVRRAGLAYRSVLAHRPPRARRPADWSLQDIVQFYGSLDAYEEEQRRCGLLRLEAQVRR